MCSLGFVTWNSNIDWWFKHHTKEKDRNGKIRGRGGKEGNTDNLWVDGCARCHVSSSFEYCIFFCFLFLGNVMNQEVQLCSSFIACRSHSWKASLFTTSLSSTMLPISLQSTTGNVCRARRTFAMLVITHWHKPSNCCMWQRKFLNDNAFHTVCESVV